MADVMFGVLPEGNRNAPQKRLDLAGYLAHERSELFGVRLGGLSLPRRALTLLEQAQIVDRHSSYFLQKTGLGASDWQSIGSKNRMLRMAARSGSPGHRGVI
jgi:hypothetical protein